MEEELTNLLEKAAYFKGKRQTALTILNILNNEIGKLALEIGASAAKNNINLAELQKIATISGNTLSLIQKRVKARVDKEVLSDE